MIETESGEIHKEDSLMPYIKLYDENTPRVCTVVCMYSFILAWPLEKASIPGCHYITGLAEMKIFLKRYLCLLIYHTIGTIDPPKNGNFPGRLMLGGGKKALVRSNLPSKKFSHKSNYL